VEVKLSIMRAREAGRGKTRLEVRFAGETACATTRGREIPNYGMDQAVNRSPPSQIMVSPVMKSHQAVSIREIWRFREAWLQLLGGHTCERSRSIMASDGDPVSALQQQFRRREADSGRPSNNEHMFRRHFDSSLSVEMFAL
jgi:hypothetical protein